MKITFTYEETKELLLAKLKDSFEGYDLEAIEIKKYDEELIVTLKKREVLSPPSLAADERSTSFDDDIPI